MLTLGDAITLCRTRANIGTGNISITEWVALINLAVRKVAAKVTEHDPSMFLTRGTFAYPASTEHITVSGASYLNATPEQIISVWVTEAVGAITHINTVISEVLNAPFGSEGWLHTGGDCGTGIPHDYHYTYHGAAKFGLFPVPDTAVNLVVNYIPAMPTLTTGDTATSLFGARGTSTMHDAVVDEVVMMLAQRGDSLNSATQIMYQQSQQALSAYGARKNAPAPRTINKRKRYF